MKVMCTPAAQPQCKHLNSLQACTFQSVANTQRQCSRLAVNHSLHVLGYSAREKQLPPITKELMSTRLARTTTSSIYQQLDQHTLLPARHAYPTCPYLYSILSSRQEHMLIKLNYFHERDHFRWLLQKPLINHQCFHQRNVLVSHT